MSGSSGVSLSTLAAQVRHTGKALHGSPVRLSLSSGARGWHARVVVSGKAHRYPVKGAVPSERAAVAGLLEVLSVEQSARIAAAEVSS